MPRLTRIIIVVLILAVAFFTARSAGTPTLEDRQTIAAEIEHQVRDAYDMKNPDAPKRFERLYPDTGRIISATGGRITASRDTLIAEIRSFWQNVGSNMTNPTWMWDQFIVDVISKDAAVMTTTYHVPHLNPRGLPHVIGGAWTAVFRRQSDGRWVITEEALSDLPPMMADSAHAHMNHADTARVKK